MYSNKQLGRAALAVVAAGATVVAVALTRQDASAETPAPTTAASQSSARPGGGASKSGTQPGGNASQKETTSGAASAGGETTATAEADRPQTADPVFLEPGELPPHPASEWFAQPVAAGLPEYPVFCLDGAGLLPRHGASHREFGTEFDTGALQLVFRTGGADAAKRLTAKLSASLHECAEDFEDRIEGGWAEGRAFGPVPAEDGGRVFGVATSAPESEYGISLFGVARDGATVTVVKWSQMGGFSDAPVEEFKSTTATAVTKLYP
ncbi:hypothetical protein AB0M28_02250 [Streptomyces sp. NPDC051940]|uniref:hypothetical protein n=1 Tax=Streptomyces sp. NPDC051940 TaxID=3155675 RepID=UPI0034335F9B